MKTTTLSAVENGKNRSVIRQGFDGPVFRGAKGDAYTCPHCGNLLATGVPSGAIFDIVIQCGKCDKHSSFPPLPRDVSVTGWGFMPIGTYLITATIDIASARFFGVDKNGKGRSENTKPAPLLS